MTTKYVPSAGFASALTRSASVVAMLKTQADAVAEEAKANAPVDSGDYQSGITSSAGVENGVGTGRVAGTDWKSGLIEAKYGILRNAMEALGFHLGSRL